MNTPLFAALALLSFGAADLAASIDAVASGAVTLSSSINAFKGSQGLLGALGIQMNALPAFEKQVTALQGALGSASASEVNIDLANKVATLESNIAGLLNILTAKAGDFGAAGATTIVTKDVNDLYAPSIDIANKLVSLAGSNCDIIPIVSSGLHDMDVAFSSAAVAYSVEATAFPTLQSCGAHTTEAAHTSEAAPTTEGAPTTASVETSPVAPVTSTDRNGNRCLVRPTQ